MKIIDISDIHHPDLAVYYQLTEAQLQKMRDVPDGLFIAESPKVIDVALSAGYQPVSLLCERKHLIGDARHIVSRIGDVPIYTGDREILAQLTGYTLTRGVLCAMKRKPLPTLEEICKDAERLVVIDGVCDTTNIGAIFRSAAALGMDGILLMGGACDPLNRRAVRVSMGSVFLVPWTRLEGSLASLHRQGFATAAMALSSSALPLDDSRLKTVPKLALVMGTEGDGLSEKVINEANYVVTIPMAYGVDSLNVAAATAVACWELRKKQP